MGEPDSSCDENTRTGYVRVRLNIPGLLINSNKQPTNATIYKEFGQRSYKITIECDKTIYVKAKQWDVPFDIVPDQSFVEVARNFVHVFLKKQLAGKSCVEYISSHYLN